MIKNIWYFHPYAGGPGVGNSARPYHLASAWLNYQTDVTIFSSAWHHLMSSNKFFEGHENIGGVRYCFVPSRRYLGNGVSRLLSMYDYCRVVLNHATEYAEKFGQPDLIIASSPHPYSILVCRKLAKRFQCKLVFEVRDLWPLSLTELVGVKKWHPLVLFTGWVERLAYRCADACVSLLPGAKQHMVERGLPPDKFVYIPNGVSFQGQQLLPTDVDGVPVLEKVRSLRASGAFVVIYPGAMGPPNNMQPLLEAASILKISGFANIQFILMGQGGELPLLRYMADCLRLDNIHFFPQAERSVALSLMSMASLGYVSVKRLAIYRHGISFNKLFEYMQQNLPVLFAADVPGNPIELSGGGVVTSPDDPQLIADAILSMASMSGETLRAMGESGYRYVEKFHDYHVLAKKYLNIFDSR